MPLPTAVPIEKRLVPALSSAAWAAAWIALCAWTLARGLRPAFQGDELYFWLNTYAHGYARRGLAATLLAGLLPPPGPALRTDAACIHLAAIVALLGLLLAILSRWRAKGAGPVAFAAASLFATSPFFGLLGFHLGYPDGLIALFVTAAAIAAPAAPAWALAALLITACALHELAMLLLLPILVFAAALRPLSRRDVLILSAGALAAFLLPAMAHSPSPDLAARVAQAGLDPATAALQVRTSLLQSTTTMLPRMLHTWATFPLNGLLGILYAALPSFAIALLGLPAARQRIAARTPSRAARAILLLLYAAACLGGLALLLLAWDLGRIAGFTTLTALLTLACIVRPTTARPAITAAALTLACAYAALPICDLYFDYGRPLNLTRLHVACPPCARAGIALIDTFNRAKTAPFKILLDTDPTLGNAPSP